MASRFWVGGTGTWDASDTTHWAATSGGAGGQSVPGASDTVTLDASSGGGTVTLGYNPSVTSITLGAFTGTFDASTFSPTVQTFSGTGTGTRTLIMGSGTWTITGNAATVWDLTTVTNMTLTKGSNPVLFTYSGSTGTRTVASSSFAGAGGLSAHPDFSVTAGSDSFATTNSRLGHLNFTGFSGTLSSGTRVIYGDLTISSTMTWSSGTAVTTFGGTSGTQTVTTNGVALNSPFTVDGVGGTVLFADNFSMDGASARTLTLTNGTLNANNKNVTCGLFASTNANIRTLTMGSGTWTITSSGTVWTFSTATNLTLNANTSTIKLTDATATTKTFNGGAKTFNDIWLSGAGTGTYAFTGTLTFSGFLDDNTSAHSLQFNAGSTYTFTTFNVNGSSGNLISFTSGTPNTRYNFSVASGTVFCKYVSIRDCAAAGGATFRAWYSTNSGNVTGWTWGRRESGTRTAIASPRYSVSGLFVTNAGFENQPAFTAATNTAAKFINGTAAGSAVDRTYGWAVASGSITASASARFDPTVSHSGSGSLKLSTENATGTLSVSYQCTSAGGLSGSDFANVLLLLPNTSYTITGWVKTNNVATNGAFFNFRQFNSAGTNLTTTASTKSTGTNDWVQRTITVTTGATAAYGIIFCSNNVAGNISDAWFDDFVVKVTNARSTTTRTLI